MGPAQQQQPPATWLWPKRWPTLGLHPQTWLRIAWWPPCPPRPHVATTRTARPPTPIRRCEPKDEDTVMQAVHALHKQADKNHDGRISDHEILDIFQGVRNH